MCKTIHTVPNQKLCITYIQGQRPSSLLTGTWSSALILFVQHHLHVIPTLSERDNFIFTNIFHTQVKRWYVLETGATACPVMFLNIDLTCKRNKKLWARVCINRKWVAKTSPPSDVNALSKEGHFFYAKTWKELGSCRAEQYRVLGNIVPQYAF